MIRIFGTIEIFEFYKIPEPGVKSTTVNRRAYYLVKISILQSAGRGKLAVKVIFI
jgi:hypothetical protein